MQSLTRLRVRLTLWYAGTFGLILALLGGGLFWVIRGQISQRLDASLNEATDALIRAAEIREVEAANARGAVVDAVEELRIPDRSLYLFDGEGRPLKPPQADQWIVDAVQRAVRTGVADQEINQPAELRVHAERFAVGSGRSYVAAVVADRGELEDEYASLIGAFAVAALLAVVLIAAGGSVLVRQSTAPVERALDHMRRFMADAAHELRTPVTVLRTRAEVTLQQARDPAAYATALEGIAREAERLGVIVDDLLLLARADAGERMLRRERIFLDDVALDAAGAARTIAERRGVTVDVERFEETAVDGDPALLRQLLLILLDNAVKFTPSGGKVQLDVHTTDQRPTVVVTDTGVGIPPEHLPHVFERFYRGDPARGRTEGAGLGLAIARWIAEAHGAEIAVSSVLGRGTGVTLRFPAVSAS